MGRDIGSAECQRFFWIVVVGGGAVGMPCASPRCPLNGNRNSTCVITNP